MRLPRCPVELISTEISVRLAEMKTIFYRMLSGNLSGRLLSGRQSNAIWAIKRRSIKGAAESAASERFPSAFGPLRSHREALEQEAFCFQIQSNAFIS